MYLNTERKRKLVSLYHQTEDFVTLQNLSSYIDARFSGHYNSASDKKDDSSYSLERALQEQHQRPKTTVPTKDRSPGGWAVDVDPYRNLAVHIRYEREEKVRAAVRGVDDSNKASVEMAEKRVKDLV